MSQKLLIVHAKNDESFAGKLVEPLQAAGYDVSHQGTLLVGESVVEDTERSLGMGVPVVFCGTERAIGNRWVRRVIHAARNLGPGRIFIVQMEEEADVESVAFGEVIARYYQEPTAAVKRLVDSLHKYHPVDIVQATALRDDSAERRYRELLLETCDIISLANLPEQDRNLAQRQQELKLRGLYIPLRVRVEAQAPGGLAEPEQLDAIWETLEKRRLEGKRSVKKTPHEEGQRVPVGERLQTARRLIVLGDPGAGKTTLTRWIATAYLLRLNQHREWKEIPAVKTLPDEDWLPIIIRCRDLDKAALRGSLSDMLQRTLRRVELNESQTQGLRSVFLTRLEKGTALLILDGLDEITDPSVRFAFCQQVENIVVAYPHAPVIATSRIVGYREMGYRLGRGFEHLTLADLAPGEKDEFVRRWCSLTQLPESRETAAKELIHDIHSSDRIERLTGNPMLLTTMALVKRKIGKLPSRRADLYWEAAQVLLNWRREVDQPLDSREALPQLQYVAYDMCDRGVQQIAQQEILDLFAAMRTDYPNLYAIQNRDPTAFLELLEARTGILVEAGHRRHLGRLEPVYEFRHLTFQEYLAARALVEGYFPRYDSKQTLADKVAPLAGRTEEMDGTPEGEMIVVESWREALRLCTAVCHDKDIDSVLLAILTPREGESDATARARSILAVSCLADEPNVSVQTADDVMLSFAKQVREPDGFRAEPYTAADNAALQLVGTRWLRPLRNHLIGFLEVKLSAGGLAGMLSVWELPQKQPDSPQWITEQIRILNTEDDRAGCVSALGVMSLAFRGNLDATVDLLEALIRALSGSQSKQIAAAWALGWIGRKNLLTIGAAELDQLLAYLQNKEAAPLGARYISWIMEHRRVLAAVEPLIIWLENADAMVRQAAASALGEIGSEAAVAPLIARLGHENAGVRQAAASALGGIKSEAAVAPLITRLDDGNAAVRQAAASALGGIKSEAAVAPLITRLDDEDAGVRQAAASALGGIKSEAAVAPLIARLDDGNAAVRQAAASALGGIKSEAAVAPLITRLDDEDAGVRLEAASSLGEIGSEAAVAPLITRLDDENAGVRWEAASALGGIKSEAAVAPLIARLEHENADVRQAAASSLGEIGSEAAVAPLITRLDDENAGVRWEAASSLGEIGSEAAVAPLITRLDDENAGVRWEAASSLGGIGSEAAVAPLIARLDDENSDMRQAALRGLAAGLSPRERILLTRDLDGLPPFLDPATVITNSFAIAAASKVEETLPSIHRKFEELAVRFHLKLGWAK